MRVFVFSFLLCTLAQATICTAHRGDSGNYLENSFAAFESALDKGVGAIEFDVQHTRDGVGIIMHDDQLEKTGMNRPGHSCPLHTKISKLTFKTIFENCRLKNGEDIPTLRSALHLIRGAISFVELKDIPSSKTLQILHDRYATGPEDVRIISFETAAIDKARSLKSKWGTPFALMHISSYPKKVSLNYDGVMVQKPSASFVRKMKQRNMPVGVWTVDDAAELEHYHDLDVEFLASNYPERCLAAQ